MIKVIVCGADGRMGREISRLAEKNKQISVVGAIDTKFENNNKDRFSSLDEVQSSEAQVVVDFTVASQFSSILSWCMKNKIALVSGTTGLSEKNKDDLQLASKKIRVFWAPNMSLGVCFVARLLAQYNQIADFEFHLTETHHKEKKDKPSGTAVFLQAELEKAIGRKVETPESLRVGEVFGDHKIVARSESEEIILEHRALNREVFARGAIAAIKWLVNKEPGLYSMKDLINS